jgi:CRP-like cAMP-binding protein
MDRASFAATAYRVKNVAGPDDLSAMAPLLRRLGRFVALTSAELAQVRGLAAGRRGWRPGSMIADGRATAPHFVLSGWACSQRVLRDGRRQILDMVLPGEGFGFDPASPGQARQTVVAITSVETVDAGPMLAAAHDPAMAGLWRAIRAMRLEEDARRLDHLVRLGRLTAYEKAAHFLAEMQRRVGSVSAASFPLPLTQEVMADALGLSVVHLNRVLRQLRAANVVEIHGGAATVRDPKALAQAAVLAPTEEPARIG